MKKIFMSVLMAVILLSLVACAQPLLSEVVRSEKQRVTSPEVSEATLTTLVSGNSVFAFDLYQTLREEDGNLFYSPYSISLALAMTYAGARGETAQQMADTLHFFLLYEGGKSDCSISPSRSFETTSSKNILTISGSN